MIGSLLRVAWKRGGGPAPGAHSTTQPPSAAAASRRRPLPIRLSLSLHLPLLLLQKLHMGVVRDEELYRVKKQQHAAGTLRPAER